MLPPEGAIVGWFRGFLALKSLVVGLAVLALWAVVGVFIASRTFRWEPSR